MSSYQSILKEMRIVRINKYIASSGVTSRRKADQLILDGKVAVNGAVMKEPGYDVKQMMRFCVRAERYRRRLVRLIYC